MKRGDIYSLEALTVEEVIDRDGTPSDSISHYLDTHLAQLFNLVAYHALRKYKLGDAVHHDTASLVHGFEDGHTVAEFGEVMSARHA